MPKLTENLPNRIRKLLKPSNQPQAFQPVLEAVSNAIMAIEDRFSDITSGHVTLKIENLGSDNVSILIRDNGIGLDDAHYRAFCEIDTEFKRTRGGKGVGRLYWLDAFSTIEVSSRYLDKNKGIVSRAFKFLLDDDEQIQNIDATEEWQADETGTCVRFRGLRATAYQNFFPKQAAMVQNHTAAEFIGSFLSGRSPTLDLQISTSSGHVSQAIYPEAISGLVHSVLDGIEPLIREDGSTFNLRAFLCVPQASRGLGFRHCVHLLGNGRTVEARGIDDLLGVRSLSSDDKDDLVLHIVVESSFLDERTVESRTAFSIPEKERSEITREVVSLIRKTSLSEQFEKWDQRRRSDFHEFLRDQPIFAMTDPDTLFNEKISNSDSKPEDFVRALSVVRHRQEKDREKRLSGLVDRLVTGGNLPENFSDLVANAADEVKTSERASLAHHAARRKVVLDLLDRLVRRVRAVDNGSDDRYHLEETLHALLVPMRIRGDNASTCERAGHDLWIIDERLAYTAGFSSDLALRKTIAESEAKDRPDILIWNSGFGLGPIDVPYGDDDVDDTKPLSKIFIVELKMPGRTGYSQDDLLERQLTKYVREIQRGTIEGFGRRKIRVTADCQFYCFVVADMEHSLIENELITWESIEGGRARRKTLTPINTVIDCVAWDDVLTDARERNRALITMAGLKLRADTVFEKTAFDGDASQKGSLGDALLDEL